MGTFRAAPAPLAPPRVRLSPGLVRVTVPLKVLALPQTKPPPPASVRFAVPEMAPLTVSGPLVL